MSMDQLEIDDNMYGASETGVRLLSQRSEQRDLERSRTRLRLILRPSAIHNVSDTRLITGSSI